MKPNRWIAAWFALLCLALSGCGEESGDSELSNDLSVEKQLTQEDASVQWQDENSLADVTQTDIEPSVSNAEDGATAVKEIDQDTAFSLALDNAGVPQEDAYNVKVERDRENDIPIFQVEFETRYGDYDFEISASDGRIIGADYEVDEEWLDRLGGSPVTFEEAKRIVQSKVSGSGTESVRVWEESDDGRGRFDGELFCDGIKYEFEIDPKTGIIFDWNADWRE